MKKLLVFVLMLSLLCTCLMACEKEENETSAESKAAEESKAEEADVKSEGVMTYAEYAAAAAEAKVTVETYVQDKQGWWEKDGVGVATLYTQDKDGAYFFYDFPCTKEVYDKLVKGTKIKATGFKSVWEGESEIIDGSLEIVEGKTYIAEPFDATSILGTDKMEEHMNQLAAFNGLTVAASKDADGNDVAFLYKWDGSGKQGDDIYFAVTLGDKTQTFVVESYLRGAETDLYKAVEALKVGDKIDLEAFIYWYQGPQPHVVNVTASK